MPVITERRSLNGFDVKVERLGLTGLIGEVEEAVTSFELLVHEEKYANGRPGAPAQEPVASFTGMANPGS